MKIHKEGNRSIRNQIIILIIISYISFSFDSQTINILLIIMLFTLAITLYFFRIPKRIFEKKKNTVYAPCDGK